MGNPARMNRKVRRAPGVRQRGLTLIETALALAIMALVVASLSMMMAENADQVRARAAADKVTEVQKAAEGYVKSYGPQLYAAAAGGTIAIPSGRPSVGAPVPSGPSGLPSLQGAGFLNSTYVDSNGYGQRHYLLVRRLAGHADSVETMVSTSGGRPIPDAQLGRIANFVGAAGGYVPEKTVNATDAGQVVGSYGGWRTPTSGWGTTAAPSVGHLQAISAFDNGTLLADYLYRNAVTGMPEANRMNTNIDMNGNDLNNAGTVNSGIVNTNTLAVTSNATVGGDVIVSGNVKATLDVIARDVTANRNMTATGNIVSTSGNISTTTGDVVSGKDVRAAGNISAPQGTVSGKNLVASSDATVGGNLNVTGKTTTGDLKAARLNIDSIVYNDSPGGTNRGLTGAEGLSLGDLLPRTVPQYSYRVTETTGSVVYKPTCKGGFTKARIMVYRQVDSVRANPNLIADPTYVDVFDGIYAVDNGSTWTVKWEGLPAVPGTSRQALAQTFCFYGP